MDPLLPNLASRLSPRPLILVRPDASLEALPDPSAPSSGAEVGGSTTTPATLTALVLSPASVDLKVGSQWEIHAVASFGDGSSRDVSAEASWSTSGETAAVRLAQGPTGGVDVEALAPGVVTVSAEYGGAKAGARVLVRAKDASPSSSSSVPRWVWWAAGGVAALGLVALVSHGARKGKKP